MLRNITGPFFDVWESLPDKERESRKREYLSEYIAYAQRSSAFYRERLEAYAPKEEYPLAKIPFLKAEDLRINVPPVGKNLITDFEKGFTVFQSGGTTGFPKTSLFTNEELELLTPANARGFYAVGLKPEDRVANLWASGSLYMTFIHMNRFLQQSGCTNFAFANNTASDFIKTAAELFDINVFSGVSSIVLGTLRNIKNLGLGELQVKKVYFGAEHIYDSDLQELKRDYGVEVVKAPGYGTVDSWYIGYQCEHTPLGVFHTHDDQCYLEIIDEENGKHCEDGEVGMAYVTTFPRRLTPVIRYRVGDRMKWLKDTCACGRTTPLFQLLGRGDDILRIGYDSVDYASIQKLFLDVDGLSGSIQMEKKRKEGKDELTIRIESSMDANFRVQTEKKLQELLLGDRPTLRLLSEKKVIHTVNIQIVPMASLKRNPRTGKLVRVIDCVEDK